MTPDDEDRVGEDRLGDADGSVDPDVTTPRPATGGHEAPEPAGQPWDDAGVDAAFADIVARLQSDGVDSGPSTTADSSGPGRDLADHGGPDAGRPAPGSPGGPREDPAPDQAPDAIADAAAIARRRRLEREVDAAVDGPDGGHFVPPDPAPLPRPDAITLLAWVAVIGGPLVLVLGTIVGGMPTWLAGGVVAAVVVGFVLLVSRLPRRQDVDPGDDGAVV